MTFTYEELTKNLNVKRLSLLTALKFNLLWATGGDLFGIGAYIDFQINNNHSDPNLSEEITLYSDKVQYNHNNNMYVDDALKPSTLSDLSIGSTPSSDLDLSVLTAFQNQSASAETRIYSGYYSDSSALLINKKLNLFGLPFLPWGALVLKGDDGKYYFRYYDNVENKIEFNPLRKEILLMKLQTIAILSGVGFVGYELLKYGYRKLK